MEKIKLIPLVGMEFSDAKIALASSQKDVKNCLENLIVHGIIPCSILTTNCDLILTMTEA